MRPPRAAIVALAAAASAFILAPHRPRACAAAVARRASDGDDDGAAAGDDADGERSLPRRLWDRVRRKGGDDEAGEVGDAAPPVLSEADTTSLYAELGKRASEVADDEVSDREIYDAISRKGDFPMVSKKLNEALRNRSMTTGELPPVVSAPDWSEFAPSSGQTPYDVISGVLRALREGARVAAVEETDVNAGVATLLRFMSPASSFGSEPVNDDEFIGFVLDSEYDVLLRWDQMSFKGSMNLNVDGNRAYQTVMLMDEDEGEWVKTKWALSLREAADCKELCDAVDGAGYWLVDNVMVSAR
mmetsp:Transcript_5845/g.18440  ORF Transcript_5845/g.18440 Transcript_5845/m.18440 type:complete len:302 (+) Transcript_5845:97-1002(+)